MLKKKTHYIILISLLFKSLLFASTVNHGQGEIVGRVTETTAILQSRLTQGKILINGDLPGCQGVGCFELAANPKYENSRTTSWIYATPENDYIVKVKVTDLKPATKYFYRLIYGQDRHNTDKGQSCSFKTLGGKNTVQKTKFVVVTGMNYFFFHEGPYTPEGAYQGDDKHLGYPALKTIRKLKPDFFVGTLRLRLRRAA